MNLYSYVNRHIRGTDDVIKKHSKAIGCFLMAVPALIVSGLAFGYLWHSTGFYLPFIYVMVMTVLSSFICLMWVHNSDDWRDSDKMSQQWKLKGGLAFGLLGNPCGYKLQDLGRVYEREFKNENKNSKANVERAEGRQWGKHSIITALYHCGLVGIHVLVDFSGFSSILVGS